MESISHDEKTLTFVGDLDGMAVFGASALGIERVVGSSAQVPDVGTETAHAPTVRRVSYEGVGLVMSSQANRVPAAKPFSPFTR